MATTVDDKQKSGIQLTSWGKGSKNPIIHKGFKNIQKVVVSDFSHQGPMNKPNITAGSLDVTNPNNAPNNKGNPY